MNTFAELFFEMERFPKIAIVGHAYPDGDCYGCQIGLRELLRARFPEKDIRALGSGLPCLLNRISPMDQAEDGFFEGALGILVDVSCLRRVEENRIFQCASWIKFDHHELDEVAEHFDGKYYSDAKRVSCCEIITEFGRSLSLSFNQKACEALYSGILTDSGRFYYYGTNHKTFEDASFLIRHGANPKVLMDLLFHEEPNEAAFKKWMRAHAKVEGQVCSCWADISDYESFGLSYENASTFVNALAGIGHAPIYIFFCVRDSDYVRVEIRSNSRYPVQPTAKYFGGGGHRYAAGMELRGGENWPEKVKKVIQRLQESRSDVE